MQLSLLVNLLQIDQYRKRCNRSKYQEYLVLGLHGMLSHGIDHMQLVDLSIQQSTLLLKIHLQEQQQHLLVSLQLQHGLLYGQTY